VDTIAVHQADCNIKRNTQLLRTRSIAEKRRGESPGFDTGREYRNWITSQGDVAGDYSEREHIVHRRVEIEDRDETFDDVHDDTTSIPVLPEETASSPEVNINYEWGGDGVEFPYPSTKNCKRVTWRLAPSRRNINLTAGCHRETYDLDLLAFQAGSNASDEEETDYLEADIDGRLIKGVPLEIPEEDYILETTNDMPGQAHSTPAIDAGDLANVPDATRSAPQAAVENRENICIVEDAPEINFEFGDEPIIKLASCY